MAEEKLDPRVVLLYRQWVADGRKIPLEEMIGLATTLLEKGMMGFRNKQGFSLGPDAPGQL